MTTPRNRHQRTSSLLLVSGLTLVLAACSSSSSNNDDDDGGGGGGGGGGSTVDDDRFHVFQGSFAVVDPADPSTVYTVVQETPEAFDFVFTGDFELNGRRLVNTRFDRVIYGEGSSLMQIDLKIDRVNGLAQEPVPTELQSFNDTILEVGFDLDVSAADPSFWVHVQTPGGYQVFEQTVSGDVSAPQDFPGVPEIGLNDATDGSFDGWLATDGGMLTYVDPDLNVTNVAPGNNVEDLGWLVNNTRFLDLDGRLVTYDRDGNFADLGFDLGGGLFGNAVGLGVYNGFLYFAQNNGQSFQVHRTDSDGPVLPIGPTVPGIFQGLALTPTRVVYAVTNFNGTTELGSFNQDGSNPVVMATNNGFIQLLPSFSLLSGERVFYNVIGEGAFSILSDGTGLTAKADGMWVGTQTVDEQTIDQPVVVTDVFCVTTATGGLLLEAVDPNDPTTVTADLGQFPAEFEQAFTLPTWTDTHLITAIEGGANNQTDVFFFDSQVDNSLVRITTTAGESEAGFF